MFDSLACTASATNPQIHCAHAGPDGGGVCVPAFCESYETVCVIPGHSAPFSDCPAAYGSMDPGTAGDISGDTAACREYHLGVALTSPDVHCPHASPDGGGVCVPSFCASYQST